MYIDMSRVKAVLYITWNDSGQDIKYYEDLPEAVLDYIGFSENKQIKLVTLMQPLLSYNALLMQELESIVANTKKDRQ